MTHFVLFVIYVLFEKMLSGPADEAISLSYFMLLVSTEFVCIAKSSLKRSKVLFLV